jgi:hypothetical protein
MHLHPIREPTNPREASEPSIAYAPALQCNVRLYRGDGTTLQVACPRASTQEEAQQERIALARRRQSLPQPHQKRKKARVRKGPWGDQECGVPGGTAGSESQDQEVEVNESRGDGDNVEEEQEAEAGARAYFFETKLVVGGWCWLSSGEGARAPSTSTSSAAPHLRVHPPPLASSRRLFDKVFCAS